MTRLTTPATIELPPAASRTVLSTVEKSLGTVPNMFRVAGNSPAALKGFLAAGNALAHASLDTATQVRIALVVADANGCDYCLSAHTYLARNAIKLDDAEITANRNGSSNDMKAAVAAQLVARSGHANDADLAAVKAAGITDAEIVEIVLVVAMNTFTNYLNEVARTEIDFPRIGKQSRAA